MNRPVIKIKWESIDYILEELALAGLIALMIIPFYHYIDLPEEIPIHFDLKGEADAYGNKNLIWILPVTGIFMYILLTITNKYPHSFNYPVKIDEENAFKQYKNATRLIRILKAIICLSFAYLVYAQIQSSFGNQDGLGRYFVPFFLILILSNTGYYFYKSTQEYD